MDIEDVHKYTKLQIDGTPYNVEEVDFMKPGKGRAIYRLKLKNLMDGSTLDRTYHSGTTIDEIHTSTINGEYLYRDGQHYMFMNTETFDQFFIDEKLLANKKNFLKENTVVTMLMIGDKPIDISLPNFVELAVVECDISTKAATVSPQQKAATLETGYTIGVPAFIKEGDVIKVDTRSGAYSERVDNRK